MGEQGCEAAQGSHVGPKREVLEVRQVGSEGGEEIDTFDVMAVITASAFVFDEYRGDAARPARGGMRIVVKRARVQVEREQASHAGRLQDEVGVE